MSEQWADGPVRRFAPSTEIIVDTDTDEFTGVFSNESVGRDNHIVLNRGIQYENFMADPVILWAHDDSQPPVGRATRIVIGADDCRMAWKFVPREISPFAGMVRDLVAGKWLRALSMSWQPLEWKFSTDRSRPGGVDFLKVDMLETSIVPIPALPSALIDARSRGVDTRPLYEWAEKLLDKGDMTLVPRDELETLRRAAKMPARSSVSADGASNALQSDNEGSDGEEKRSVKAKHSRALSRAPAVPVFRRGLYDVAQLACMLEQLGYCHTCSEYEAALEGDKSEVPAMLGEALKQFGEALIAMTEEEVTELLESVDEEEAEEVIETRSLAPRERAWIAAAETPRARAWRGGIAVARAGKALSASNKEKLEEAHDHSERAMKHHRALGEQHEAAGGHLDAAQGHHERATKTLDELGIHVRAAQENPEDSGKHLEEATRAYRAASEHMGAVSEAHDRIEEAHEDAADSHHTMGRSVKRSQRCMRSVLDSSAPEDAKEPKDDTEQRARDERVARAQRLRTVN